MPTQPVININVGTPGQSTFQPQTPNVTPQNVTPPNATPPNATPGASLNEDNNDDEEAGDGNKKTIILN